MELRNYQNSFLTTNIYIYIIKEPVQTIRLLVRLEFFFAPVFNTPLSSWLGGPNWTDASTLLLLASKPNRNVVMFVAVNKNYWWFQRLRPIRGGPKGGKNFLDHSCQTHIYRAVEGPFKIDEPAHPLHHGPLSPPLPLVAIAVGLLVRSPSRPPDNLSPPSSSSPSFRLTS